jgi:hypothetical protein
MSFITSMRADAAVISAEPNAEGGYASLSALVPNEISAPSSPWTSADRSYLEQIRAYDAWSTVETSTIAGQVTLGFVDKDFLNPSNVFVDDITARATAVELAFPIFADSHGFRVATIAAATGQDFTSSGGNDGRALGINWHSKLRLIAPRIPLTFNLRYLIAQEVGANGVDVLNFSVFLGNYTGVNDGMYTPAQYEDKRYRDHRRQLLESVSRILSGYPNKKFLVVDAAGNDPVVMNWEEYRHQNILTVGTADDAYDVAYYSARGSLVDVYVPSCYMGASPWYAYPFFKTDGTRMWDAGTSFSDQIVSGIASLILERLPSVSVSDMSSRIIGTAQSGVSGVKILDMARAIGAPSRPTSLVASALSTTSIGLSWIDNSSDETGFSIERGTDGTTFTTLITTGANTTAFVDSPVTSGTTYFYRIASFNAVGNSSYSNTSSATPPSGTGTGWTQKIANGSPGSPPGRTLHGLTWAGNQAVLFGGMDSTLTYRNDVWWYDPVTNGWTSKIAQGAAGSPPSRRGHTVVWDGARVVLFGGYSGAYFNDVWWYDPASNTWSQKIANGSVGSPTAREGATIVWDGSRAIMFGGYDGSLPQLDLWWYSPATNSWTQKLTSGSPDPGFGGYPAVWDGSRVLYALYDTLWWYDPGTNTWTQKISSGTPGAPAGRHDQAMVWDGSRAVMFGGQEGWPTYAYRNDVWWYNPATNQWTEKIPQGSAGSPPARQGHRMAWDSARFILFAGNGIPTYNDLWWYQP